MNLKLDGSGVAVIGALGVGAYLLIKYRPWTAAAEVIDNIGVAVDNVFDRDGNGQVNFDDALTLADDINPFNLILGKPMPGFYETNSEQTSLTKIFIGPKKFPAVNTYKPPKTTQPAGTISVVHKNWSTHHARGNSAKLTTNNASYQLWYDGRAQKSVTGDPRFLWCLDLLLRTSGIPKLENGGVQKPEPTSEKQRQQFEKDDFGHWGGHGIDIKNHDDMNAILKAAAMLNMPLGWISRTVVEGKGWPKFLQNEKGQMIAKGHSTIPHNDHYHLILPRPNSALQWWKDSPYWKGGSKFGGPDGGGGGSTNWGDDPVPPINPNSGP